MEQDTQLSCWVTQLIPSDCLTPFLNVVMNKGTTNSTAHFILETSFYPVPLLTTTSLIFLYQGAR